jgi:hypothetical protein
MGIGALSIQILYPTEGGREIQVGIRVLSCKYNTLERVEEIQVVSAALRFNILLIYANSY